MSSDLGLKNDNDRLFPLEYRGRRFFLSSTGFTNMIEKRIEAEFLFQNWENGKTKALVLERGLIYFYNFTVYAVYWSSRKILYS